ncbi:MAG: hypothetical protein H6831_06030 [Planctomycetes bacterium]|nr:hypothetical protein [Planctomycetota bacterium]MCB9903950.1 hypothetical protein [Planctomycetota bacterium]
MHDEDQREGPAGRPEGGGADAAVQGNSTPPTGGGPPARPSAGPPSPALRAAAWRIEERAARIAAIEPHTGAELRRALVSPFGALELVLADQERVAKDILGAGGVTRLIAVLLGVSLLYSVPYGLVLGLDFTWRVGALFLGSLAICLPSLQVFSNFIGIRIDVGRNAALTLLVTSVAAAFSFGFFPILWFLRATMADGEIVNLTGLSVLFLTVALFAGIAQLLRCLGVMTAVTGRRDSLWLIVVWLCLLLFVTLRMARTLGLTA